MIENERIDIRSVGNGFAVIPYKDLSKSYPSSDELVFQSFSELMIWLNNHFTFRITALSVDGDSHE